jgi:retron-type reverse transcriptase
MSDSSAPKRLGYARVSTVGQTLEAQLDQLKAARCSRVYREKVSGARVDRKELGRLLKSLAAGDQVVVKRDAAPGVDGMTWETYEHDLDQRIEDLRARVHAGTYRALPSRRSYIPKEDGSKRPLAVAAIEDKIVQRAVAAVLSAIHEEDFLGFSYGFRPKRSQHDALDALIVGISSTKVSHILDADICSEPQSSGSGIAIIGGLRPESLHGI